MGLVKKLSQKRILRIIDKTIEVFEEKGLRNQEDTTSKIFNSSVEYFNKYKIIETGKNFPNKDEEEILKDYILEVFDIKKQFPERINRNKSSFINLTPIGQQRISELYKETVKQLRDYS